MGQGDKTTGQRGKAPNKAGYGSVKRSGDGNPYWNLLESCLGSLGFGALDAATGITAGAVTAVGGLPAAAAVFIGFLLLNQCKTWKQATSDKERLDILNGLLDRTRTLDESLKALDLDHTREAFDNELDHEVFLKRIKMLRTSLMSLWDVADDHGKSIETIRQSTQDNRTLLDEFRGYVDERFEAIEGLLTTIDRSATAAIKIIHNQKIKQKIQSGGVGVGHVDNLTINMPSDSSQETAGLAKARKNNLPYGSIRGLFKGREEDVEELEKLLGGEMTTAITSPGALYGLGGIGKTRLAVEYAWRALKTGIFDCVYFVGCGASAAEKDEKSKEQKHKSALGRFHAAVNVLAKPGLIRIKRANKKQPEDVYEKILKALSKESNWLVIFDNVDDIQMRDVLLRELPRFAGGKVLITSRLTDWGDSISPMRINKLSHEDSAKYLLETTEDRRVRCDEDESLAKELAEKLDGLPVALEQAGAYIRRQRIGFARYLELYEANLSEVLDNQLLVNLAGGGYERTVATTWQITVGSLGGLERTILCLSSFLSADEIPVWLFEKSAEKVREAVLLIDKDDKRKITDNTIHNALITLDDCSMIDFEGETFSIHRVVQEVTRLRMDEQEKESFLQIIIRILETPEPDDTKPNDVRSWGYWKPIETHIAGAICHCNNDKTVSQASALMTGLGLFYRGQARYAEAEPLYNRALEINEKIYGKEHPGVATNLNNLAGLYQATGRLKEAKPLYERALEIDEKVYGKEHPIAAIRLNNLAGIYQATGRFQKAEPLFERAVEINEKVYGKDHPEVAINLNNLAGLYRETQRPTEAEKLYERALKIDKNVYGKEHPNVAIRLNNLATLFRTTGRLKEAKPLLKCALDILERRLGTEHPTTKKVRKNLAILREKMKDPTG